MFFPRKFGETALLICQICELNPAMVLLHPSAILAFSWWQGIRVTSFINISKFLLKLSLQRLEDRPRTDNHPEVYTFRHDLDHLHIYK